MQPDVTRTVLHLATNRIADRVWQWIADMTVTLFESYKTLAKG